MLTLRRKAPKALRVLSIKDIPKRVIIEKVYPEIDSRNFPAIAPTPLEINRLPDKLGVQQASRFPIKRCVGDILHIHADIYTDGHDSISADLCIRHESATSWERIALTPLDNDSWQTAFPLDKIGTYYYTVQAWIDEFKTWRQFLCRKMAAGVHTAADIRDGAEILRKTARRASPAVAQTLLSFIDLLNQQKTNRGIKELIFDPHLLTLVNEFNLPITISEYPHELTVVVDRQKASFSTWYELFPRSLGKTPTEHGTLQDVIHHLPYIRAMGFDVLYLPPIHPIGRTHRKGKNNQTTAEANDPGSPWAIGDQSGGHRHIHPELGTLTDFRQLLQALKQQGMELAMDFALQCSPDHPYLTQHPEWFKKRSDGSLQCAENPPKTYEDIYPFDFTGGAWESLWHECKSILQFWINEGVRIFRVDNPHTKPLVFWHWLIPQIKKNHPDVIFLSEAFTRPKIMYQLAKIGFTQSYTYFTWRNTKEELISYFQELTAPETSEFFRPCLWINTPDILSHYLQEGGRPAFIVRLILAATLSGNYGIYGPSFELCLNQPLHANSEEYVDSEKYQLKSWNLCQPHSLATLIKQINQLRQDHPALQTVQGLRFHPIDNDHLLCYSKQSADGRDRLLILVNLDPTQAQKGELELPVDFITGEKKSYTARELLRNHRHVWHDSKQTLEIPTELPAYILQME